MKGKILGIPLILILMVLLIAALVDIPMMAMFYDQQVANQNMKVMMYEINAAVKKAPMPTPTTEPTPTSVPVKGSTTLRPSVSSPSGTVK